VCAAPLDAQERRTAIFGTVGGAGIGHADSEQGKAPFFGAGVGFRLAPRFVVEGDVHHARVSHVFGRDHHDFSETTLTASLLFRSAPRGRAHFIAGGGSALQSARIDIDDPPFRIDRPETIQLLHGRMGTEWDVSNRIGIRAEGVIWLGEGLDWVLGARAGLLYRF
jgi:hypothetical protein